jgi:hypothetical protein
MGRKKSPVLFLSIYYLLDLNKTYGSFRRRETYLVSHRRPGEDRRNPTGSPPLELSEEAYYVSFMLSFEYTDACCLRIKI